jgi:hypothetical protein
LLTNSITTISATADEKLAWATRGVRQPGATIRSRHPEVSIVDREMIARRRGGMPLAMAGRAREDGYPVPGEAEIAFAITAA